MFTNFFSDIGSRALKYMKRYRISPISTPHISSSTCLTRSTKWSKRWRYIFVDRKITPHICKLWPSRMKYLSRAIALPIDIRPRAPALSNKQRQPQRWSAVLLSDHKAHHGLCYLRISRGPNVLGYSVMSITDGLL